jgi:nucleotide-binding universal stress UspA family protein
MKTILCPTDFSENCIKSLLYAYDIALQSGAELLLLHTYHIPRIVPLMEGFQQPELGMHLTYEREVTEKMDNLLNWLNKIYAPASVRARYKLVSNFATDEIIKTTYDQDVDLIVMGTKSKDLKDIFLATNTVRVIEETPCPLLVVPDAALYTKISHILYTSHNPRKEEISCVRSFAKAFNASVTLLHIPHQALAVTHQAQAISGNDLLADKLPDIFNDIISTKQNIQKAISSFIADKPSALLAISAYRRNLLHEVVAASNTSGQISHSLHTPVLILK